MIEAGSVCSSQKSFYVNLIKKSYFEGWQGYDSESELTKSLLHRLHSCIVHNMVDVSVPSN